MPIILILCEKMRNLGMILNSIEDVINVIVFDGTEKL